MATRKPTPLGGGLIARKGAAQPSPALLGADVPAQPPATPAAPKDTIALTVRLDPELYLRLKRHGVSFRPRKTSQAMIVEAIEAYLDHAAAED